MTKYCINNLNLSNNDIFLIIILLIIVSYLFYNVYVNSELFVSNPKKIRHGTVLDYEGNGNYIIEHTNKSKSTRSLIIGDIMYKSTIKFINKDKTVITISSPSSVKFDTRVDPNFVPGLVYNYRGNGIYDIDQIDGSKSRRPLMIGDIIYGSTIININETELTLKNIPGEVLGYQGYGDYVIKQQNGYTIKRKLQVNDIMYETTIIAITKDRKQIILSKLGKQNNKIPVSESIPGIVGKYEGNGNYSIYHTDNTITIRPLIIGDKIFGYTIKFIKNNRITLENNEI